MPGLFPNLDYSVAWFELLGNLLASGCGIRLKAAN